MKKYLSYASYSLCIIVYAAYQVYFLTSERWREIYFRPFINVTILAFINVLIRHLCPKPTNTKSLSYPVSLILKYSAMVLFIPFYEEYLFREFLPKHFTWFFSQDLTNYICSLLFGIVHSSNIIFLVDKYHYANIIAIIQQIIFTTLLGLFISVTSHPLPLCLCVLLHAQYNLISIVIYTRFIEQNDKLSLKKTEVVDDNSPLIGETTIYMLKRHKSVPSNMNRRYLFNDYAGKEFINVTENVYNQYNEMNQQLNKLHRSPSP